MFGFLHRMFDHDPDNPDRYGDRLGHPTDEEYLLADMMDDREEMFQAMEDEAAMMDSDGW